MNMKWFVVFYSVEFKFTVTSPFNTLPNWFEPYNI